MKSFPLSRYTIVCFLLVMSLSVILPACGGGDDDDDDDNDNDDTGDDDTGDDDTGDDDTGDDDTGDDDTGDDDTGDDDTGDDDTGDDDTGDDDTGDDDTGDDDTGDDDTGDDDTGDDDTGDDDTGDDDTGDDDTGDDDTGDDDTGDDDDDDDCSTFATEIGSELTIGFSGEIPAGSVKVYVIDDTDCLPIEGAFVQLDDSAQIVNANGIALFTGVSAPYRVTALAGDFHARSFTGLSTANVIVFRLESVPILETRQGQFVSEAGEISTLLPQAPSFLGLLGGDPFVLGMTALDFTEDELVRLDVESLFSPLLTMMIEIPPITLIEFKLPGNLWIPALPFAAGLPELENDPYTLEVPTGSGTSSLSGTTFSLDDAALVLEILGKIAEDPFPYWELDWERLVNALSVERIGLEPAYDPASGDPDVSLDDTITTVFGSGVPAESFQLTASGLPDNGQGALDVFHLAAGIVPDAGVVPFWVAAGNPATMGFSGDFPPGTGYEPVYLTAVTDFFALNPEVSGGKRNASLALGRPETFVQGAQETTTGFLNFLAMETAGQGETEFTWTDPARGSADTDLGQFLIVMTSGRVWEVDLSAAGVESEGFDLSSFAFTAGAPFDPLASVERIVFLAADMEAGFDYNSRNADNSASGMQAVTLGKTGTPPWP